MPHSEHKCQNKHQNEDLIIPAQIVPEEEYEDNTMCCLIDQHSVPDNTTVVMSKSPVIPRQVSYVTSGQVTDRSQAEISESGRTG